MTTVSDLTERLEKATGPDNRLDIAVDVALFVPDDTHKSVRPNDAGTKLVYTRHDGRTDTYWARDHTLDATGRELAIALLRARSHTESQS